MDMLSLDLEIVVAKLEGEKIIRLKELCTHMDITVERLRRRPLFCIIRFEASDYAIKGR